MTRRSPVLRISTDQTVGHDTVFERAQDTADSISVVQTGPTGVDAYDPLVIATVSGQTAFYPDPEPSIIEEIVAGLENGRVVSDTASAIVNHEPETRSLPVPETGPLAAGQRDVLGPCGWVNPLVPADYDLVASEYNTEVLGETRLAGRARGDATSDEAVRETWDTIRETDGEPVVVVNANDTDGRQQVDTTVLAAAPIAVLDGISAIAQHVGATEAVLYLNETETTLHSHLESAIDAAADVLPIVPQLVAGPDEYRAGSPTAALEALEGNDRVEPRLQPPSPAVHGLHGRPTAVHSIRTVLQVRRELQKPSTSDKHDPGTRLFSVTGDVTAPAIVELGSNATLETVLDAVEIDGSFKMACVGGVLGGITKRLDVPATQESLHNADLSTEGVIELLNTDRCAVTTAGKRAQFAATENSGRCIPGREGTKQLTNLLRDVYQESFEREKIRELGRVMSRTSNCRIGASAPKPVITAINEFESEFYAHTDGRCPSGTCTEKL